MQLKRRTLFIFIAIALTGAGIAGVFGVGSALSRPVPVRIGPPPRDLGAEPVEIPSSSGSTLHGWFCPGRPGHGAVVLMHGVRSNRLSMLERARWLHSLGFSVLLFDFQAHGESPGNRITFGWLEGQDARSAVKYLRQRLPGESIGAVGVSLGGAAALVGDQPLQVDALVLESVYPTIEEAIADRLRIRCGPMGPVFAPLLTLQLKPRLGISKEELRPIDNISKLAVPVFVIAGSADRHTTMTESERLFEHARQPKQCWWVRNAAHVDLYHFSPDEYRQRVLRFLMESLHKPVRLAKGKIDSKSPESSFAPVLQRAGTFAGTAVRNNSNTTGMTVAQPIYP